MNTNINSFDLDAIELAPVTGFDSEASGDVAHLLAERVITAPKVSNVIGKNFSVTENDSAFQRMLSAVTGFFKQRRLGSDDAFPSAEPCVEQPAPPQEKHTSIVIRGQQQLRTLYHLLNANDPEGIPIDKLRHLVGAGNQWDTVRRLNCNVGEQIVMATEYLVVNKTGKATRRANYWLTAEGRRIAPMILANSGYVHDATSEGRHLQRPDKVAAEFVARSLLDGDDLLMLRDGTRPQWLRLLQLLRAVKGEWVSRYVADELLDSCNVRQVVRVANAKVGGRAIENTTRTMQNRDGGYCDYGLYRITDDWGEVVDKVIKDKLASAPKLAK